VAILDNLAILIKATETPHFEYKMYSKADIVAHLLVIKN
jgi:hypothetical protein